MRDLPADATASERHREQQLKLFSLPRLHKEKQSHSPTRSTHSRPWEEKHTHTHTNTHTSPHTPHHTHTHTPHQHTHSHLATHTSPLTTHHHTHTHTITFTRTIYTLHSLEEETPFQCLPFPVGMSTPHIVGLELARCFSSIQLELH